MDNYSVCAFYKFIKIKNLQNNKKLLYEFLIKKEIKGTIIIAREGINGTVSGNNNSIKEMLISLCKNLNFKNIEYKISYHFNNPFYRTKIRVKNEIVTLGNKVNPRKNSGTYIEPEKWNELITDKDTILVDTRNEYEISIGTFKNSINPHTNSFRDFPLFVDNNLKKKNESKKIAMFCTGGIRCEKSTAYLKENGYENVYHLKGGILNYLKKIDKKESLWIGECFVFDNRVSVNHDLIKGDYDQCHACRIPISENDKKSKYYKEGVSCPYCYNKVSNERRLRFKERQKQINLAKKRGIEHLGVNQIKNKNLNA